MDILKNANLLLRFLLELCALVSLGFWGFQAGKNIITKIGLGIGAPLLAAFVWGMFIAPNASAAVSWQLRLLLEFTVLGSAALALYVPGHRILAVIFNIVWVINRILIYTWEQSQTSQSTL